MQRRIASINDLPIKDSERKYHWTLGRRPDDHPSLDDLPLLRARRHRPCRRAAKQRDELASSQLVELHSVPSSQAALQDIEWAGISHARIGAAIGTERLTPSAKRMSPAAD